MSDVCEYLENISNWTLCYHRLEGWIYLIDMFCIEGRLSGYEKPANTSDCLISGLIG